MLRIGGALLALFGFAQLGAMIWSIRKCETVDFDYRDGHPCGYDFALWYYDSIAWGSMVAFVLSLFVLLALIVLALRGLARIGAESRLR